MSKHPQVLQDFLENHTVPILKELAKLLTSRLPTRKAELVALIQRELENPGRLRQLWNDLDELQQAAISETVHSLSPFDAARFRAKYGRNPDWGQLSRYGRTQKPSPLHLFIYGGVMPRDLKERLKTFVPPPRTVNLRTLDELPASLIQKRRRYDYTTHKSSEQTVEIPLLRCETEGAAQHDVHAVLRLIEAGKVQASAKTKRVTAASARAIVKMLQGGDFYPPEEQPDSWHTDPGPIKAFAWPLIVQSAGLANLFGTKLQLTSTGKKALTSPPHQVIRKAWNRWQKTRLLDEFSRVHTIKGQTRKRNMTALPGRRTPIVEALATCPAHEWIAFDEFSRFMRASGHTFEVSHDLWKLYISDANYGSLGYAGFGDWHVLQGRYILAFLFEYAATLGLIDVAYVHPSGARPDFYEQWGTDDLDCLSRYDGLMYFRINGLGAWCLELTEKYVPSAPDTQAILKVLPNMDIVATAPLPPGDVLILERFAEQTSDVVWKIHSPRLLKALEEGQKVVDIEAFLKAKASDNLPDTVTVFFQEVAERASRLVDRGPARLIEVQDAALAQLIVNDRRLKSLCMLAGERHIVVADDAESAFRRALRELGYALPLSSDRK